ncbi:MAG: MATE family efflux transporter [Gammaproteobacteria bacterium]|nr:MATE family efflux transporter [Gammaproteobacteria bacterium]
MRTGANLTEGPVGRHLINLTIPMFLGIASMIVASMMDTIYVGWIGTLELAAVSFTFPVVMGLSMVSMGIGIGAASIISRVIGAGDHERVRRLATDSFLLVAIIALIMTAVGFVLLEPVFRLLGAGPEILPLSIQYMSVWFIGMPAFALPMVGTIIMRAVGNARLPGIIMAAAAGLQVVLAPVLIFGIPGLWDGLGFAGAAWGFVLSRIATFIYTVRVLMKLDLLHFEKRAIAELWTSWREIMRIGLPSMMSNLVGPVSMAVIVALLAGYGHVVVAGFGVASRIESLAIMILMALSASTGPFVGQNWGAGNHARIYTAHKLGYRFSYAWGVVACVVLAGMGDWLIGFINEDPAVVEATYAYLLLVPVTYGFFGASMVAMSTFIALGKPMPTLIMSVARMLVVYVPVALYLETWFGYRGIYAAAGVANVVVGIVSVRWVNHTLAHEISRGLRNR